MSSISTSGTAAGSDEAADGGSRSQIASKTDYLLTYAASCLTSVFGMVAFRLAHQSFAGDGFAEYALTRRSFAFLVPLFSMGMAVAIAKAVACQASKHRSASIQFLGGGLLLAALSGCVFLLCVLIFPGLSSFLCVGDSSRPDLVFSLVPLILGLILTAATSAYCRGRMWIGASNVVQLICTGIIPNFSLLFSSDVGTYLSGTGYAICAVNGAAIAVVFAREGRAYRGLHLAAARALFRFGAPRVPGDLAYYGLLAAPALAAANQAGMRTGGEIAYAMAWLTLLSQLVAPLSMLLLPEASYLLHSGRASALRHRLLKLLGFSIALTCAAVGLLIYFAPTLLALHLGTCSPTLLHNVRALLAAAIPLNVFIGVRSIIDAGESRAVSPMLCIGALALFGLLFLPGYSHGHAASTAIAAFNISVAALAISAAIATYLVFAKYEDAAASDIPQAEFGLSS